MDLGRIRKLLKAYFEVVSPQEQSPRCKMNFILLILNGEVSLYSLKNTNVVQRILVITYRMLVSTALVHQ